MNTIDDVVEPKEKKTIGRLILNAFLIIGAFALEQLVYLADLMLRALYPTIPLYIFLNVSGLYEVDWVIVWLGISSVAATLRLIRK